MQNEQLAIIEDSIATSIAKLQVFLDQETIENLIARNFRNYDIETIKWLRHIVSDNCDM